MYHLLKNNACSNGHAICKDLVSSPTYDQWSFPPTRFLQSPIETQPNVKSVPCVPIIYQSASLDNILSKSFTIATFCSLAITPSLMPLAQR